MSPLFLFTSLTLLSSALAQTTQTTWSAVTFTYHGEKVPDLANDGFKLTALGANQLFAVGQLIRARYIDSSLNATGLFSSPAPINGLSVSLIDNSQLFVLGADDEYIQGSALAFLQGLYPPVGFVYNEETELANKTAVEAPLGGYQYPSVNSVSALDFNVIWVAGNIDCASQSISNAETLSSSSYTQTEASTISFYQSLGSSIFAALDPSLLGYQNAWELYEYALHAYNHNSSIYNSSTFSEDDLSMLYNLASQQQLEFNTPSNGNDINGISGKSLAGMVVQQFSRTIDSSGVADKLTLMFGSFEPFLAFFSLSGLATGPSAPSFNSLPLHGSTMTFELFSYPVSTPDGNLTSEFPSTSDLWVRLMFRNGTASDSELVSYPLFGRGPSEVDMTWTEFIRLMGDISLDDVEQWCTACQTITLFCEAIQDNISDINPDTSTSKSHQLNPIIGGVIGAIVALALFIIIAALLMLFGFRLAYHPRNKGAEGGLGVLKRNGSGGQGGFKGAEKLASDTDLALKGGAGATVVRHERVGSWELGDPAKDNLQHHASLDKEIGATRADGESWGRRSVDSIAVNPFGDPVRARESV